MQTNQARWAITGACAGLLLALGWLDYRTGYELGFFIFYSIPVSITAWYAGRFPAILMSLASALVWLIADSYTGQKYSSLFFVYWNIAVRGGSFVINAFTVFKISFGTNGAVIIKIFPVSLLQSATIGNSFSNYFIITKQFSTYNITIVIKLFVCALL